MENNGRWITGCTQYQQQRIAGHGVYACDGWNEEYSSIPVVPGIGKWKVKLWRWWCGNERTKGYIMRHNATIQMVGICMPKLIVTSCTCTKRKSNRRAQRWQSNYDDTMLKERKTLEDLVNVTFWLMHSIQFNSIPVHSRQLHQLLQHSVRPFILVQLFPTFVAISNSIDVADIVPHARNDFVTSMYQLIHDRGLIPSRWQCHEIQ